MYDYIVVNQAVRSLYIDILNELAADNKKVLLITGDIRESNCPLDKRIVVKMRFKYNNARLINRMLTFLFFYYYSLFVIVRNLNKKTELILTTTPPFLPFIGLFLHKISKIRYHLVIYDIYPDVLLGLNFIKKNGAIDKIWTNKNKKTFEKASTIITISEIMANTLKRYTSKKIDVVYNWVDSSYICPMQKSENWFALKYNLENKLTILYSGNFGATHDIESIIEAAKKLKKENDISFILIGEGAKRKFIIESIKKFELKNIILLPLQDFDTLPYSLTSADVGIVTLDEKSPDVSVPSKTYFLMAAGLAILGLGAKESELGNLIENHKIGEIFGENDFDNLIDFIFKLKNDNEILEKYKRKSRETALLYTPQNAKKYLNLIIK